MKRPSLAKIKTYHIGLWQTKTYRLLQKHTNAYLEKYNLSAIEWAYMGIVFDAKSGLTLIEIAHILGTSKPFVTNMTKKLTEQGIITVKVMENDSRSRNIQLTKKGEQFIEKHETLLRDDMRKQLIGANKLDVIGYINFIKKIANHSDVDK